MQNSSRSSTVDPPFEEIKSSAVDVADDTESIVSKDVSTQTKNFHEKMEEVHSRHYSLYNIRRPALSIKDEYQVENLKHRLRTNVKDFSVITSMDGLAHIFLSHRRNPFYWKNIVFLVSMVLFMIFNSNYMVTTIAKYLKWPVVTKVKRDSHNHMDFPAVTLCNINRIKAGHRAPVHPPTHESSSGIKLKEMLISCSFGGDPCNTSDFHWLWSHYRGNCYTFNNHIDDVREVEVPSRKIYTPGRRSSLILTLDVGCHHYSKTTDRFGVLATVHERTKMPDLEGHMIESSPGYWTTIQIKKTEHQGMDTYGCKKVTQEQNRCVNFYAANYTYTEKTCQHTCEQVQAMKEFQCCIRTYPCNPLGLDTMLGEKLDPSTRYCNTSVPNNMTKAHYRRWTRLTRKKCQNLCEPECDHMDFKTITSTFRWPRKGSVDYDFHSQRHHQHDNVTVTLEHLRENIMVFEVFFSTFDVITYVYEPKYLFFPVLSNIGAMLGVFFGFSLTTSLEFGDFLMDALLRLCKCRR